MTTRAALGLIALCALPACARPGAAGTRAAPAATVAQPAPAASAASADPIPPHETFTIDARALGERRVINVYLPAGYAAAPDTKFPVLYMPDGGLAEDFPHVANTIDSLIALGRIPAVLVVGIENTQRRRDLTGPTTAARDLGIAPRVGGSAAFRAFIRDEVMPEVRKRYRTSGETSIVGESLAGLFVVETMLVEPALFQRYIAIDPSVWWNGGELVRGAAARLETARGRVRSVYLTSSSVDDIAIGTAALARTLAGPAGEGIASLYEPRPDLEHGTIFRATAPGAFVRVLH